MTLAGKAYHGGLAASARCVNAHRYRPRLSAVRRPSTAPMPGSVPPGNDYDGALLVVDQFRNLKAAPGDVACAYARKPDLPDLSRVSSCRR
jgi:hypothetical protein